QGVAHFANEDQSEQIRVGGSDRAALLAGAGAGHELRKEPAAVIPRPDRGAGFERVVGQHVAGEHYGQGGPGDQPWGHEEISSECRQTRRQSRGPSAKSGLSCLYLFSESWV